MIVAAHATPASDADNVALELHDDKDGCRSETMPKDKATRLGLQLIALTHGLSVEQVERALKHYTPPEKGMARVVTAYGVHVFQVNEKDAPGAATG